MIASRFASALVRTASVATRAMVVEKLDAALHVQLEGVRRYLGGVPETAELRPDLPRRGPEVRSPADHRRADGVDDGDGADLEARCRGGAGRAEPALEGCGGGAVAAADGAEREGLDGCGFRRLPAELPVGGHAAPVLVAAVDEVEDDGLHRHGDVGAAELQAAALLAQIADGAAGRVETEQRAAAEQHGVDAGDGHLGLEQCRVARAGRPAARDAGGDVAAVEDDRRDPAGEARVMGIADADAGHVGDEVVRRAQALARDWYSWPPRQIAAADARGQRGGRMAAARRGPSAAETKGGSPEAASSSLTEPAGGSVLDVGDLAVGALLPGVHRRSRAA